MRAVFLWKGVVLQVNLIDRMVGAFLPNRALQRAGARERLKIINQGYGNHGASTKKKSLMRWTTQPGSMVEDVEYNIPKLRERSRDLYMGPPLATGTLKTLRTNGVGAVLKLNAQIDYDFLNMSSEEADE